jgi:hypothetical protein
MSHAKIPCAWWPVTLSAGMNLLALRDRAIPKPITVCGAQNVLFVRHEGRPGVQARRPDAQAAFFRSGPVYGVGIRQRSGQSGKKPGTGLHDRPGYGVGNRVAAAAFRGSGNYHFS